MREPQVGDYVLVASWSPASATPNKRAGTVARVVRRTKTTAVLDNGDILHADRRSRHDPPDFDPWFSVRYVSPAEAERWIAVRVAYLDADQAWRRSQPTSVQVYDRGGGFRRMVVSAATNVDSAEECETYARRYLEAAAWLRARPVEPTEELLITIEET